jgi:hypothetical protein
MRRSISVPGTKLTSVWVFLISARKAGSFASCSKAVRNAVTRSAGTPGEGYDKLP